MSERGDADRVTRLFEGYLDANYARTSRVFGVLMLAQWAFAIGLAILWSPYAWEGRVHTVHVHVYSAVLLGGAISSLPLALIRWRPAALSTRMVVAVAQVLWSALLIHLSGGRIETHFHVFVSLAFLAFYRDWRVLVPATLTVVADHLVRGILWPESVYGIVNPEWWRFFEHAFWVVFEDVVLLLACIRGVQETRNLAARQVEAEDLSEREKAKSAALAEANAELEQSKNALAKLAAVGELAASIGHELRNPLGAIRNGLAYVSKRARDPHVTAAKLAEDKRFGTFLDLMDREIGTCSVIIGDLLDFARERPPDLRPCPLKELVDDAVSLVPAKAHVSVVNAVPSDLPIPHLDKDQFRQTLVNLVQNGAESIPPDRDGVVTIRAEYLGDEGPLQVIVTDNGVGIPETDIKKIFQPLFTTKTKGTGLGLAIVAGMVQRHGGLITAESKLGEGTTFKIELPRGSVVSGAP